VTTLRCRAVVDDRALKEHTNMKPKNTIYGLDAVCLASSECSGSGSNFRSGAAGSIGQLAHYVE
jgi:hypothetical protein